VSGHHDEKSVGQVALFVVVCTKIGDYKSRTAMTQECACKRSIDFGRGKRLQHKLKCKEVSSMEKSNQVGDGWRPVDFPWMIGRQRVKGLPTSCLYKAVRVA